MQRFWEDLCYSVRLWRKNPSFMMIAVLALALSIGANTAIFSVVDGVLLRALPYTEPDQLVTVYEKTHAFGRGSLAYPNFLDWRRENHCFQDIAAFSGSDFILTGSGQPERLSGEYTSASLIPLLGVNPLLGRSFLPEEDRLGANGVVILSYGLWQRRFGATPEILGRSLTLNGRTYSVIGVLPQDFRFREGAELYLPLGQWDATELRDRNNHMLRSVARLKSGVTRVAAEAEMNSIARQLAEQYPKTNSGRGVRLVAMKDDLVGHSRRTLLLLAGAVGFVLLIACANVANLLLAQSTARRREFAIRVALGATRIRVTQQLLTESILLAVGAGAIGLMLAFWGTRLVLAAFPSAVPSPQAIEVNLNVLLFTLIVSLLTGVLFGLVPAFHSSNVKPQDSLKKGARDSGRERHRTAGVFVVLEVGLAVVLLAGAGLMIQSIWRLWRIDPGFDTRHLLTARVGISPTVMANGPAIRVAYQQMVDRVAGAPGVQAVAITTLIPLGEDDNEIGIWLGRGTQPPPDQLTSTLFYITTPDYLRVMGIPLLKGRFFTERDSVASTSVVVIDDVLAKQMFPGQDPLGQQINMVAIGSVQVVGVVGHVKHWGLDADEGAKIRNEMYFPFFQIPDKYMPEIAVGGKLLVRTTVDPFAAVSSVRAQVVGPTNDQPLYHVASMEQIISNSLAERRFSMLMLVIFASTALLLASVGIYGVVSYAVTQRTGEIGVRMALGADRFDVLKMVIAEGLRLVGAGLLIGLTLAVATTRLLSGLLFGVSARDPLTLVSILVLLAVIAVFACYVPARRASKVDPMVALRYE